MKVPNIGVFPHQYIWYITTIRLTPHQNDTSDISTAYLLLLRNTSFNIPEQTTRQTQEAGRCINLFGFFFSVFYEFWYDWLWTVIIIKKLMMIIIIIIEFMFFYLYLVPRFALNAVFQNYVFYSRFIQE